MPFKEQDFNRIYIKYGRFIFLIALSIVKNEQDAEDVTQNTFIELFKQLAADKSINNVKSWLGKVAKNKSIDHIRKKSKEGNAYEIDETILSISDKDKIKTMERLFPGNKDKHKLITDLEICINSLSKRSKQCIILYYYKQKKYIQIAEYLDILYGNVRSTIYNAKKTLKKLLKARGWTKGDLFFLND